MEAEIKLEDLEKSLMLRANDLAEEYRQHAKNSHDRYIADENEHLQLREQREILAAKMSAERTFRSQVQSSELSVQKKLDQLRWQLIKDVMEKVEQELNELVLNKEKYLPILINFISDSIHKISYSSVGKSTGGNKTKVNKIILELNQQDYDWLVSQWPSVLKQLQSSMEIELSTQFHQRSGGVVVYDESLSIRIDNTLEGRMERLSETIYQRVSTLFFSELSHEGDKIRGR